MNALAPLARLVGIGLGLLIVSLALCAPPALARKSAEPEGKSGKKSAAKDSGSDEKPVIGFYATTMARSSYDVVLVQYWSKGPLFRAETMVSGHPIVTLVNGDEYYTWDALTGEGYVVKRPPSAIAADSRRARPFGNELDDLLAGGGEKVRSETMNGIRVDVYRMTDDDGRRTLWVDADRLDLPIRLETYDRASGRTANRDWISWIPGLVIPDAFFDPPRNVELTRFESYQAYLQQLSEKPTPPTPPLFHYLLYEPDRDGGR